MDFGWRVQEPQPPSGGCVLKLMWRDGLILKLVQPPSGGCVLKLYPNHIRLKKAVQPPSGGCVLKLYRNRYDGSAYWSSHLRVAVCWNYERKLWVHLWVVAATFGWLCVETSGFWQISRFSCAATFGWLCVETNQTACRNSRTNAATFGWLCVETVDSLIISPFFGCSHLRVAVCWNSL